MAKSAKKNDEALIKVDTSSLKALAADMENFIQGPGTVADRQALLDRLNSIISSLES